jgi:hypothetical protein
MKVEFADSFFDSLKTLSRQNTWWYKTYKFLRWDIKHFIQNVWTFRKELWDHRWWDYRFTLNLFERSLQVQVEGMSTKGYEVPESREPKVKSMHRVLELLKNNREDNYIVRAEQELGEIQNSGGWFEGDEDNPAQRKHNRKVFVRARQIEQDEWKELWTILEGTKHSKKLGVEYDGSDMRGWWD